MTPMIDVVFLLIIFFLVSSHLARQETQLELDLPLATTHDMPHDEQVTRITLNLLVDGRMLIGASETDPAALESRLRVATTEATLPVEVRVRADRDVSFALLEPALVACAKAGVWNVTFATLELRE
jgi:biopolymer transport protein ExbD